MAANGNGIATNMTKNAKTNPFRSSAMDKLPSSTLKRHPKMDLNKSDLLRLLSYLEGELQARDITIAALKAEKAKQLLYQAKYGRFGLGDPFLALQRDSDSQKDNSFDEAAVKAMYDNQLTQLENLIDTQRKAQQRMREQLAAVEKRYHKVCAELDDEKRKHAQDTAQGDDVTYMLEKERERLKQELEFEKSQAKKLDKESKKTTTALEEERAAAVKHKQVALMLIKERKKLAEQTMWLQHRAVQMEKQLHDQKTHVQGMGGGLIQENQKCSLIEAQMEKQLSEFDIEREQLRGRLSKEEAHNRELSHEVLKLQQQLEQLHKQIGNEKHGDGPKSIEIKSSVSRSPGRELDPSHLSSQSQGRSGSPGQQPSGHHKATPPHTPPETRKMTGYVQESPERDLHASQRSLPTPDAAIKRALLANKDRTIGSKPIPAEKPPELSASRGVTMSPNPGQVYTVPQSGTHVFTTPSGTRISLTTGPSSNQPRKVAPAGRGIPPPVPPNKPQVVIPGNSQSRKDNGGRPGGMASPAAVHQSGKPQPPTKVVNMGKDKLYFSDSEGSGDSVRHINSNQHSVVSNSPNLLQTGSGDTNPMRKPSQFIQSDLDSPDSESQAVSSSPNLDIFGPEMADLQKLLVSMATGESNSSSLVDLSPTSSISTTFTAPKSSLAAETLNYPLHKFAATNDVPALKSALENDQSVDANQKLKDGTCALHCAAEMGNLDCLKLLLQHRADVNSLRQDCISPVHLAAAEGHYSCIQYLLDMEGNVHQTDQSGWQSLHWAANGGHSQCCQLLLDYGARIDSVTNAGWTPLHASVHAGHLPSLERLLTHPGKPANQGTGAAETYSSHKNQLNDVINMSDNDGWTLAHLAATKETKDFLEMLEYHCHIDLNQKDKWNRTIIDVASQSCREFLEGLDDKTGRNCTVFVELPDAQNNKGDQHYTIGNLRVSHVTTWDELEEQLGTLWTNHNTDISIGLKTRKMSKMDQDSPETSTPFTVGLSQNSIKHYAIGVYCWSPGTPSEKTPFEILCQNNTRQIALRLFGLEDSCLDAFSYESLIPLTLLQNYMRLVEQYRNLVFYGPRGTGKTFMVRKLATCLQSREHQTGKRAEISFIQLASDFSKFDLHNLLIEKGCLLPASLSMWADRCPVLVFDDLSQIALSDVFTDIIPLMDQRGPKHTAMIETSEDQDAESYYLHTNCFILGTMDRSRAPGLDLSIQQWLRWVHLRHDQEPMRGLLARQLWRQLVSSHCGRAPTDDPVRRATEWVVCVWQRLNEGLAKLGLHHLVFGPSLFLSCPVQINKPKAILRWLSLLWNHTIAPVVSEAVIKGSGMETGSEGQQKVAKTALYVLMQRAVVSGCPLSGQEKERYLASFQGSNELDIKMRIDRRETKISPAILTEQSDEQSPDIVNERIVPILNAESPQKATLSDKKSSPARRVSPHDLFTNMSGDSKTSKSTEGKKFGNTIFALSGIPASKPLINGRNDNQTKPHPDTPRPSRSVSKTAQDEDHVISQSAPTHNYQHDFNGPMHRSFEESAFRSQGLHPSVRRSYSPTSDVRRANSPELHRPDSLHLGGRRAMSPGPGQGIPNHWRPSSARSARPSDTSHQLRWEFFKEIGAPTVVNTTKLQPLGDSDHGQQEKC